jgi:hypothetical protein
MISVVGSRLNFDKRVAYIDIATNDPIAPESSLPGRPSFWGEK